MPIYIYKHPKKNKYVEILQSMNDEHTYTDDTGVQYERVFTAPQGVVKTPIRSAQEFAHVSRNMKGSIGDLTDKAQELAEQRKKSSDTGEDKVQNKFFDNWSKKRKGKVHPEDKRKAKTL